MAEQESQEGLTNAEVTAETVVPETTVVASVETEVKPTAPASKPVNGYWWGTGRRKTSVARVRVRAGNGRIMIKNRTVDEYFAEDRDRQRVRAPLAAAEYEGKLDVFVNVKGGGYAGQAGAVVLGIARALKTMDPGLEGALRSGGYLTRDARMVERKKYGQRGARRSFQFSKR